MDKIRLWAVRRWLRLLPDEDLKSELDWRWTADIINKSWDRMNDEMLKYWLPQQNVTKPKAKKKGLKNAQREH